MIIYWVVVGQAFFYLVERPMNRIDMLFSINGLLILEACSHSHSFAGRRDKMLINYCFVSTHKHYRRWRR